MAVKTQNIEQLNTQVLEVDGLKDNITAAYVNDATEVTVNLYDKSGAVVQGFGPISLVYVDQSNGVYRGAIAATFNPSRGGGYTLKIDGTDTQGNEFHIEQPAQITVRQG